MIKKNMLNTKKIKTSFKQRASVKKGEQSD